MHGIACDIYAYNGRLFRTHYTYAIVTLNKISVKNIDYKDQNFVGERKRGEREMRERDRRAIEEKERAKRETDERQEREYLGCPARKDNHASISNLGLNSLNSFAYIDFQRAFDSVPHPKLLHKLSSYGIHGILLFWISSFLSHRLQRVRVGSALSGTCSVTSGVPQGSVIGCLLFNLYINDITDSLDSTTTSKIFADDLEIYILSYHPQTPSSTSRNT